MKERHKNQRQQSSFSSSSECCAEVERRKQLRLEGTMSENKMLIQKL